MTDIESVSGAQLDFLVAMAERYELVADPEVISEAMVGKHKPVIFKKDGELWLAEVGNYGPWAPSEKWGLGGPLMEENRIECVKHFSTWWCRIEGGKYEQVGDTYLEAAMRCFVASVMKPEEIDQHLKQLEG